MEDVPSDVVTPEEHMTKLSKHRYHINMDLASSFEQIWVDESKYPYLAFKSPFKGQFIICRTVQGQKGCSETLKKLTLYLPNRYIYVTAVSVLNPQPRIYT